MIESGNRQGYRTFSAMLSMLVGIGLVRYSYSPLLPSMLDHHWIDAGQAGYLGTVNFIGNLVGALVCAPLARRFGAVRICRIALLLGLVSVSASAWDLGFWWLVATRSLAGLSAAGAMILSPIIASSGVENARRGRVIGIVFAGAGLGVIGLSFSLPLFLGGGPWGGWLFTAVLVLVCTLLAWRGLVEPTDEAPGTTLSQATGRSPLSLWILGVAYTLAAVGIVPHSIYLSAYVHQVLGEPVSFATMVFGVYGVGVLLGGPLLDGQLTGRLGTWLALLVSTAVGLAAVAVVLLTDNVAWVVASGGLLGMSQMGVASITAHRVLEIAGPDNHTRWWARVTVGFNIGQAGGALAMGAMLHAGWHYATGFWMAAVSFTVSIMLAMLVEPPRRRGKNREVLPGTE
ncbi:MAG: YbfB/YjiJ family MFS transporter [Mariniblastus sp.]|nr:YbfB/YjiJ family MFS transporter [Mariniblastus sp.]